MRRSMRQDRLVKVGPPVRAFGEFAPRCSFESKDFHAKPWRRIVG
jgi:hypothetical protein